MLTRTPKIMSDGQSPSKSATIRVMMFLLRFEEKCEGCTASEIAAGTMTSTAVRAEEKDSDREPQPYAALHQSSVRAGTMTGTRIRAESPDSDPSMPQLSALPTSVRLALGTCTATNVNAEDLDSDPDRNQYSALF
ncbi:MAG: hypothetical protein ACJAVK_002795 [Akkermansiaceae bacterium]|jgi:hypothetical protein